MPYDLVIKNGTVIDGSGLPRYRADVAVRHGRIAAIGRIREAARKVIDADGQVVTPGFVDGHTHMDAQIFWDPMGTCSCWHGVTTVVMGNCGFTLAPCGKPERHLVVRNLERAEDIAAEAMDAGIDWTWTTFPEFLDRVEGLPKGINYAGYIGHSALRTYVMGERAFEKEAGEDDLRAMERELRDAIRAGAIGFTTSRSPSHETPDRRPVASRLASWDEVRRLVGVMGDMNAGVFELAGERAGGDPERLRDYVLSFKTTLPFDRLPVWRELRALPLEQQKARLRDPELRRRLVEAARERDERRPIGAEARLGSYEWIFVMDTPEGPYRSVAAVARERGLDPVEAIIDLALEKDLDRFFLQPIANENQEHALELMKHPRTVVTFSDSGAHVSQIMDASLQTHLLSYWVRARQALPLEQAVRMLSFEPATHWGFTDRGLVREDMAADLLVFDPETIAPEMPEVVRDLPAGARRLTQRARGIAATVVNGEVVLRDGKPTGALPGQLLRAGARAR
ncbi:MAG: hypothetical protein DME00_19305 [Candidatus Rokuibacteriota bacterium]|nr:MAG: hypothetical protein DME00_19305 [Candidatus Rokubacteria bacterium]